MTRALSILGTLTDLVGFVVRAIRDGRPERVERILPETLRTTLARALADAEAEERFARRDEPTIPVVLRDAGEAER